MKINARTLGIILSAIGFLGALISYISILFYNDIDFLKMSLASNIIQAVAVMCLSVRK